MRGDSELLSNVRQVEILVDLLGDGVAEGFGELLHGARLGDVVRVELSSPERSSDVVAAELHSVLASHEIASIQAVGFDHLFASRMGRGEEEDESVWSSDRATRDSGRENDEPRESESHLLASRDGKERASPTRVGAAVLVVASLHGVLWKKRKR